MQENVRKSVVIMNVVVSVVFVLLFAAHLFMLQHMQEWSHRGEGFWPNIDLLVVRPLLALATGYALLAALFSLLKAKLEIAEEKRRYWLRAVMSVITVVFVAAMLLPVFLMFNVIAITPKLYLLCAGVCKQEWLWLALGVYWFFSLNALRVTELEPLDDEDDDFDDDDDF